MPDYSYRLVNVFADAPLEGNPLCVFEDARGMSDQTMQALALQFNLSETTFILPSATATARVRIFTPTFEMPFAGHPTLGTAHVVRNLLGTSDAVTLDMKVGTVPVVASGNQWTLSAREPATRRPAIGSEQLARILRLSPQDIGADVLWVDTGAEQLIVPLASVDAVPLAGQAIWHFRDSIAAHFPASRSALVGLCAQAGCTIRPLREVAALLERGLRPAGGWRA